MHYHSKKILQFFGVITVTIILILFNPIQLEAKKPSLIDQCLQSDRLETNTQNRIEVLSQNSHISDCQDVDAVLSNSRITANTSLKAEQAENLRILEENNYCKGCNLANLDLRNLDLIGVYLERANLSGSDLREVDLVGASLEFANLKNANLAGADLEEAILRKAKLEGANLQGANLCNTILANGDLGRCSS